MKKKLPLRAAFIAVIAAFALVGAGVAFAFDSGGNPGAPGPNTITWTGQGASNGVLNTTECDANNTPYLLWIFTTDGGSAQDATLYLGGTGSGSYAADTQSGNTFHFLTPYFVPDGSLTAYADFTTVDAGSGAWNLVISHGCPGGRTAAAGPTVSKDAAGSYDDTYTWTVKKDVDKSSITVNDKPGVNSTGTTVTVNYTITDTHSTSAVSNVKVKGTIDVNNPDSGNETLDSIKDEIVDGSATHVADCTVDTTGDPTLVVAPGHTYFPYSCDLGTSLPSGAVYNYVKIAWSGQDVGTTQHLAAGSADFTTPTAIKFTANEIDECDTLTDTNNPVGLPHKYCVGDAGEVDNGDGTFSFTFKYSKDLTVPALGTCVDYKNTATSTTNDLGLTPSASKTVTVCHFNAPLTIGYWMTHMYKCASGEKTGHNGCNNNGPFVLQYLPKSLGGYLVDTTAKALAVFNANNCSNASTSSQNAVGCLAAQLLAAKLNIANGADPSCISSTITAADAFLVSITYTGPTATYTLTAAQRAQAISLKTALDNYNNNGC
jgi:hypothetical protein